MKLAPPPAPGSEPREDSGSGAVPSTDVVTATIVAAQTRDGRARLAEPWHVGRKVRVDRRKITDAAFVDRFGKVVRSVIFVLADGDCPATWLPLDVLQIGNVSGMGRARRRRTPTRRKRR